MSEKFSKEDITEIASKLEWKPSNLSYGILYVVMALILLHIFLMIYLVNLHYKLKCKFKDIHNKIDELVEEQSNFSNNVKENFSNYGNEIRYLTKRSERNNDNSSLAERTDTNLPVFENEKENGSLFLALRGD
jgi:cell division protein FtsL